MKFRKNAVLCAFVLFGIILVVDVVAVAVVVTMELQLDFGRITWWTITQKAIK
jgi:hypothetical protein